MKRKRETSDPNLSPPTLSEPHRRHRLRMHGGHIVREREREQGGREARRSLEAAAIAPHSGGIEAVQIVVGREGWGQGGAACWRCSRSAGKWRERRG
jgi:hypothetical protein